MSAEYQPNTPSWERISTKSSRLSYALGIVKGITEDVETNLRRERDRRKRKLENARLTESKGEAYAESDDEDDDHNNEGTGISLGKQENNDFSSRALPDHTKSSEGKVDPKAKSISGIDLHSRIEELEKEEQAVLVLVDHNKKIAEEILKECNIKLTSGRKPKAINFDRLSYDRGIKDSKEIDMNQRAIRDEVKVKVENNY